MPKPQPLTASQLNPLLNSVPKVEPVGKVALGQTKPNTLGIPVCWIAALTILAVIFPTASQCKAGQTTTLPGTAHSIATPKQSLGSNNPATLTQSAMPQRHPNVVLFLVDDLGVMDVGCYGSPFHQTPNIDALAGQGIRFTAAYAAASVCSPTRASIMTGQHPVRVDITDWIPGNHSNGRMLETPQDRSFLPLEHTTLAEAFKQAQYKTFFAGKWHLGGAQYAPDKQGFDVYFDPHHNPEKGQPANQPVGNDRPHASRVLTQQAIDFMRQADQQPFFAMISYFDVHTPIIPENDYLAHYQNAAKQIPDVEPIREHQGKSRAIQNNPQYASMVSAVDESVGKVMDYLTNANQRENTIVVFFSDNGGLCTLRNPGPTSNLPLRSGKGWLYEGGIRVPMIVAGVLGSKPGTTCQVPLVSTDLYPTLLALANVPCDMQQAQDGADLSHVIQGIAGQSEPAAIYWHYPHYHGSTWTPGAAIRSGDWKLIHFYESGVSELYNLKTDPGEQSNLAQQQPQTATKLLANLQAWQDRMGAKIPKPYQQKE